MVDAVCYERVQSLALCDAALPVGVAPSLHRAFVFEDGEQVKPDASARAMLPPAAPVLVILTLSPLYSSQVLISAAGGLYMLKRVEGEESNVGGASSLLSKTSAGLSAASVSRVGGVGIGGSSGRKLVARALIVCTRLR